ncbi:protein of unknown function (DU1801) [Chitinophaga ginsengisegetis]|uniref:YdhG-like domain-containing protein n=1 Tax=Chitinophaga ginsengisegetis TaxID=393003 RepID=A0A1T5PBA3_9BACT|nr:DUF1801 domain-containing protein [Chitinophaga ginsengisegetis]SKD10001.1 protein of unknown function (DU1801) [Chitinophaga ginsengisegetis]
MSKTNKIDEFLSKLKHPLKTEMESVIKIIREASPQMEEDVKWGGPSFDYKEPMATLNPRMTDFVAVIFHKGELLNDNTGLLEPGPKGKAYAKFRSMEEVKKHKANLQKIVKDWIKIMNS